ncbi:MAG: polymer-forming cytoskeletal protein [Thermodesulfobacteriota bacterium]
MSIFNEKKESLMPSEATPINSIIGQDMTINGDLSFSSKIQVDGKIEGNLSGDCLVLSGSGKIIGDIEASTVICHGQIDGNIKVGELFLKKSGVVNGRIETSNLSVESGGTLNGEIKSQTQNKDLKVLEGSAGKQQPQLKEEPQTQNG